MIGAIYFVAKIENVFTQMKKINRIFATGTAIALVDYSYFRNFISTDDYKTDYGYEKTGFGDD